jgi:hypothetical protein
MISSIELIIRDWDQQGMHRAGLVGEKLSGEWLIGQIHKLGGLATCQHFDFSRICIDSALPTSALTIGDEVISGLPLFDAPETSADGVTGRIVPLGEAGEIGYVELTPDAATLKDEPFALLRRRSLHQAIVVATRVRGAGIAPLNARHFPHAYGAPVLQVAGSEATRLASYAARGETANLRVRYKHVPASSFNILSVVESTHKTMPPLVVITPRTSWFTSTAERAGGIAIWLHIMQSVLQVKSQLQRDVWFVATAGHEIGHIGIDAYINAHTQLKDALWLHLGANLGAATDARLTLRTSDEAHAIQLFQALTIAGYDKSQIETALANHCVGEARDIVESGAKVISMVARNKYFHSADDRLPHAVSIPNIEAICRATLQFLPTLYLEPQTVPAE